MCSGAARNGRIVVSLAAGPRHHEPLVGDLPAEQGVACLKSLRDHTDAVKATGDRRCRTRSLHYDRQPAPPTAGARRLSCAAGDLRLASDEGGESGGRPVRVQSNMADTLVDRITGQTSAPDVSA